MRNKLGVGLVMVLVGALAGLIFASVSTYDFAMHLDREMHDLHCSFIPGAGGGGVGESGCQVTLMSPYSSVLRTAVWGGVPVSLPGMAVFAFLLFFGAELALTGRRRDRRALLVLLGVTGAAALTSVVMGYLSVVELDAACKLCIGIYLSSALCLAGAVVAWREAPPSAAAAQPYQGRPAASPPPDDADPAFLSGGARAEAKPELARTVLADAVPEPAGGDRAPVSWAYVGAALVIAVIFVATPVAAYVAAAPDHGRFVGSCGGLDQPDDDYGVMISLGSGNPRGVPAVEILDPLCPSCRGFEKRLAASGMESELDRRLLLFPLDDQCNWMLDYPKHPGACAVSEAMLCAGDGAGEVLDWAFANQEAIRTAAKDDPAAAVRMVETEFPALAECVGSPGVKARLNRSLRWAVANEIPVLTPQLYVGGVKLCDEDVDLGLSFALRRLVDGVRSGALKPPAPVGEEAEVVPAAEAGAAPAASAPAEGGTPAPGGAEAAPSDSAGEAEAAPAAEGETPAAGAEAAGEEAGAAAAGAPAGDEAIDDEGSAAGEPETGPDEAVPDDGEGSAAGEPATGQPATGQEGTEDSYTPPEPEAPAEESAPAPSEAAPDQEVTP